MAGFQLAVLCLAFVCSTKFASSSENPNFSEAAWDGTVAYFVVSREKVAAKLAELQQLDVHPGCGSGKLSLPNKPILQNILRPDEHVVAVSFGILEDTSVSIPENMQDQLSTTTNTVQFFIPFLTGEDPDDEPVYKLALASLVPIEKTFINPNPDIPTVSVESIVISHDCVSVKDGAESFLLLLPVSLECITPDGAIEEEFEVYNAEYTLSFDTNQPCACQYWIHESLDECNIGALRVGGISPNFQEVSLLAEDQSPAILSVTNRGIFHIGTKNPCF